VSKVNQEKFLSFSDITSKFEGSKNGVAVGSNLNMIDTIQYALQLGQLD